MASGQFPTIKVWELKTPIHCAGCHKKIKKILDNTEGVIETEIDPSQSKVTVKAIVDSDVLIKRLAKHGKYAQLFPRSKPENPENPVEATGTAAVDPPELTEEEHPPKPSEAIATDSITEEVQRAEDEKTENENPEKSPEKIDKSPENFTAVVDKEGSESSEVVNSPMMPEVRPVGNWKYAPEMQLSYNVGQPSYGNAYYATPVGRGEEYGWSPEYASEYYYCGEGTEGSYLPSGPAYESMSVFSDENPNGCSLM